ncbi:sensor histidine kinase [Xanthocytophaga flava]|uniref:sensor histidine kinase n=1 Tax=Xanthocytophaga flava TaxID=3048013 RepID=UPI0028D8B6E7|nr:ATP-binding protein [Xanthocytophaga flavus]MDJ1467576.1 ATP-binding protein [Xanthocytophaga flavus]
MQLPDQIPTPSENSTHSQIIHDPIFNAIPGNHLLLLPDAPRFTIAAISDDYLSAFGVNRESLLGQGVFEVFFSDGRDEVISIQLLQSLAQVLQTRQPNMMSDQSYQQTHPLTGATETRFWRPINKPVLDNQGQVSHIIHTTEDVTHSRQLVQASQAREYLQTILNLCKEPVQVLEPIFENDQIVDFTFALTNKAYAAYANATPEQLEGKRVGEVFPGYLETISFTNPVQTYTTGEPLTFEIHYDKDGLDLYNLMSTFKLNDQVVIHFTDFTNLKHLQFQLEDKIVELKGSNQRLEDFAHAASHDLKEPVRKIQAFSKLLKSTLGVRLGESESALFDRMLLATDRMNTLIEALLAYSEVDQQGVLPEMFSFNEVVAQVLTDLDFQVDQAKATIQVGVLCEIKGYRSQWEQAFQNLLSNALKYIRSDVEPLIDIDCISVSGKEVTFPIAESKRGKDFYMLRIADNGIGFEQADAERIFNVFTRLHGVSEYKGSGIGLATVKKVVTTHGGYIWADSKPNEGATFYILLPKN